MCACHGNVQNISNISILCIGRSCKKKKNNKKLQRVIKLQNTKNQVYWRRETQHVKKEVHVDKKR